MAWTITDQGKTSNTSGATLVLTVAANASVGDGFAVLVSEKGGGPGSTSIADSAGNTWTRQVRANYNNSSSNGGVAIYTSILTHALTGGSSTITYTKGVSGNHATIAALSVTTGATISVDTALNNTAFGSSATLAVTSGTPGGGNRLVLSGGGITGSASTILTIPDSGNGWATPFDEVHSGTGGAGETCSGGGNKVNAGSGTVTTSLSAAGSGTWGAVITGFSTSGAASYTLTASQAAFALTGEVATQAIARATAFASFVLSGEATTQAIKRATTFASFVLTGQTANQLQVRTVAKAAFTLTGEATTQAIKRAMAVANFTLTGFTAAQLQVRTVARATFTLTGEATTRALGFPVALASFALTAFTTTRAIVRATARASFTFTGNNAAQLQVRQVARAVYTLTGYPVSLFYSLLASGAVFVVSVSPAILWKKLRDATYDRVRREAAPLALHRINAPELQQTRANSSLLQKVRTAASSLTKLRKTASILNRARQSNSSLGD